jgi:hypothetical protein
MEKDKIIKELDTVVGMLIVAAMKDDTVKEAMERISQLSFDLTYED